MGGQTVIQTNNVTTVLTVAVPNGNYAVTAAFDAENYGNPSSVTGSCDLGTGGGLNFTIPPNSMLPVALSEPWESGFAPPIPLHCRAFLGNWTISNASVVATSVANLHQSFQNGTGT